MKVIVQRAFGVYSVGTVIPEMPANQARTLIARGMVREEEPEMAFAAPVNRMMAAREKKAR